MDTSIYLDLSVAWSMIHVLILFIFLFESRYPRKKTLLLTLAVMGPLAVYNVWFFIRFGATFTAQAILLNCTLPSLLFFFVLAKHRDGRFFFTFCLADTISYEIMTLTRVASIVVPMDENVFMLISRLILFPLVELLAWVYLRKRYLELQQTIKKGWVGFALVSILFYLLLVVMSSYPVIILERREEIPATILVMILMPLMYWNIFSVLNHQRKLFIAEREHTLLHLQSTQMEQQIRQITLADERLRIARHDYRHHVQIMKKLLESGNLDSLHALLGSTTGMMDAELNSSVLCEDPILNATLTAYFRKAEDAQIDLRTSLSIPKDLTVNSTELSTVFANALENAIRACQELPAEKRWLRVTFIAHPRPMFEVSNACAGTVPLDEDGLPIPSGPDHGFGTRSIAVFCEKNDAFASYEVEDGKFTLRILL